MRARTSQQGNSRIVRGVGGNSNCLTAAAPPRRLVTGWRLVAANFALALGIGLRLTGADLLPIPAHDQPSVCQHADWLDDVIDTILGGGTSPGTTGTGGTGGGGEGGGTKP